MRQNVVLERAFQMKTMLANVALESSHACVRQLMRLQHGRPLEFRRAKIARVRRVRRVHDHVGAEAAGPQEAFAAGRALVGPRAAVHQLVIAQGALVQQLLLALSKGTFEQLRLGVRLCLVLSQLVFLLERSQRVVNIVNDKCSSSESEREREREEEGNSLAHPACVTFDLFLFPMDYSTD